MLFSRGITQEVALDTRYPEKKYFYSRFPGYFSQSNNHQPIALLLQPT